MKGSATRHCNTGILGMGTTQIHPSFGGPTVINQEEDSCDEQKEAEREDPEADLRLSQHQQRQQQGVSFIRCASMDDDLRASPGSTIYRRDILNPSTTGGGTSTVFARFHPTDEDLRFFKAGRRKGRARLVYDLDKEKFVPEYPSTSHTCNSRSNGNDDEEEASTVSVAVNCEAVVRATTKSSLYMYERNANSRTYTYDRDRGNYNNNNNLYSHAERAETPSRDGKKGNANMNQHHQQASNEAYPAHKTPDTEVRREDPSYFLQPIITFTHNSVYFDLGNDCVCSLSSQSIFSKQSIHDMGEDREPSVTKMKNGVLPISAAENVLKKMKKESEEHVSNGEVNKTSSLFSREEITAAHLPAPVVLPNSCPVASKCKQGWNPSFDDTKQFTARSPISQSLPCYVPSPLSSNL